MLPELSTGTPLRMVLDAIALLNMHDQPANNESIINLTGFCGQFADGYVSTCLLFLDHKGFIKQNDNGWQITESGGEIVATHQEVKIILPSFLSDRHLNQ